MKTYQRIFFKTLAVLLLAGTLTSCIIVNDRDYVAGRDGRYFMSVSDYTCIQSYWDNNPCRPAQFNWRTYYGPCSYGGTYNYEYFLCQPINGYSGWNGTYTVYINYGEPAQYNRNGRDGADLYFDLKLYWNGLENAVSGKTDDPAALESPFATTATQIDTILHYSGYSVHLTGQAFKTGTRSPHPDSVPGPQQ